MCLGRCEMSNEDNQLKEKQKAYFNAGLNAWLQTRMERDRQILTLSSAFFGVLMIFYRDGRLDDAVSFVLWSMSGFLFIATIVMILKTFSVNADYLEQVLSKEANHEKSSQEMLLEKFLLILSKSTSISFCSGVALIFFLAIYQSNFTISTITKQKTQNEQHTK